MAAEIRVTVYTSQTEVDYHGHEGTISMTNVPTLPPSTRLALGQRLAQVGQELALLARRDIEAQQAVMKDLRR